MIIHQAQRELPGECQPMRYHASPQWRAEGLYSKRFYAIKRPQSDKWSLRVPTLS